MKVIYFLLDNLVVFALGAAVIGGLIWYAGAAS